MAVGEAGERVGGRLDLGAFVDQLVAQRTQEEAPFVAFEHAVRPQGDQRAGHRHGASQHRRVGGQTPAEGDAGRMERDDHGRDRDRALVGQAWMTLAYMINRATRYW